MIFKCFDSVEEIKKGWSGDKKYCAVKDGTKYLLRLSPISKYSNRRKIHRIMLELTEKDVSMCKPLKVGLCTEGTYILQSWVDGIDAEEHIHDYNGQHRHLQGLPRE